MNTEIPVLQAEHIKTSFVIEKSLLGKTKKKVQAVNDVSFSLEEGDILGIVGESGCGKSTLARTVLRLIEPESGSVFYRGEDLAVLGKEDMRKMRQKMQIVFQDPYASLNPRMTIGEILESPLRVYKIGDRAERQNKVREILELTGLREEYLERYPHEFSGGQRQRVMIARALILEPDFLVFDEPVSALDVSVRSQILNLLVDLREKLHFTALFISHDLSVVKYICNRTAVMYLGHIVELAEKTELYEAPLHPYTQALLEAIPIPEVGAHREHDSLKGEIPSPLNPPSGCPFHTRCPRACETCKGEFPQLREISPGHWCACHLA
jgi:oligopeptide/dipeptide ABC transporter ATP-binding protein